MTNILHFPGATLKNGLNRWPLARGEFGFGIGALANSSEAPGLEHKPISQSVNSTTNKPSHQEETLQRDIARIRSKINEMCELAEGALRGCVRALVENDRQQAYAVILRDRYIDEKEKEIDRL